MKKSLMVRILAALGGVTLWLFGLCALAETFFRVQFTAWAGRALNAGTPLSVLIVLLLAIALCAFGTGCMLMLSSKRAAKRKGFVMQKGENGMIGVSVKSIEGLVLTCVKQHEVVERAEISVVERRDGIVILLNIQEAAGVNIPLAVGALQKQIKQYVNECTGVDVHEVRVMVENTDAPVAESPYAVKAPVLLTTAATAAEIQRETPAAEPVLQVQEPPVEENPAEAPVEEIPAALVPEMPEEAPAAEEVPSVQEMVAAPAVSIPVVPVTPIVPVMPELIEEEDDRPLHQRLFGTEEQPAYVPAPPELMAAPVVEEPVEEIPAEAEVEAAPEEIAGEIDANAVLEVVQAIAQEEELAGEEQAEEDAFEYDEETLEEQAALEGDDEEVEVSRPEREL